MDEGRIKQDFFIGKVSDSLLLVFERDLRTGGEIFFLVCYMLKISHFSPLGE